MAQSLTASLAAAFASPQFVESLATAIVKAQSKTNHRMIHLETNLTTAVGALTDAQQALTAGVKTLEENQKALVDQSGTLFGAIIVTLSNKQKWHFLADF